MKINQGYYVNPFDETRVMYYVNFKKKGMWIIGSTATRSKRGRIT